MAAYNAGFLSATYFTIFALTLVLSSKKALFARLGATVAMAALLYVFCATQVSGIHSPAQRAPTLTMLWVSYVSAAEMLLLSRVDAADLSELSSKESRKESGRQGPRTASLAWNALCLYFNFRRSGTRWAIRNIPRREPQSTMRFVATTAPLWIAGYLVMNLIDLAPLPELYLVAEKNQTLLHIWELSAEAAIFRLVSCIMFWTGTMFLIWLSYYGGALVTLLLGLSTPAAWPPLFGPLESVNTLSGFWG